MKTWMLVLLSAALALATAAWSQNQSSTQSGNQANQGSQSQTSTGNQNMSGTVSHDRKTITNDKDDKRYKVDNPEALQGQEDQHVALIIHFDPDNNMIHVIQVEPPQR